MKGSEITRENFTEAMYEVVKGREDFVYNDTGAEQCVYQDSEGNPSCLIGHVLDRLGVPYDPRWDVVDGSSDFVFARLGIQDHGLAMAARRAQHAQDGGYSWGYAMWAYEDTLERVS